MPLHTENNPGCPHCVISSAIIAFRLTPEARQLVEENRRRYPDACYAYSDDQVLAFSIVKALGIVLTDLQDEEPDLRIRMAQAEAFLEAQISAQLMYSTGQIGGEGEG